MPGLRDASVKPKGAKKEKDPNAPKRPQTAYFLFAGDKRAEVKATMPDAKVTEIAKELGKKWKDITEEEKEKYAKMAVKDKERYQREMAKYNK